MARHSLILPLIDIVLKNADEYQICPGIRILRLGDHYAHRIASNPEIAARYGSSLSSMKAGLVVAPEVRGIIEDTSAPNLMEVAVLAAMSARLATGLPIDIPFWFEVEENEIRGYGNTRIKTFRLENRYTYPLDEGQQFDGIEALQSGYAGILKAQLTDSNKNVLLRALKFAAIGFETRHVDSRLVNNTVFLESLFSNADAELSFQIASRISWYLEHDGAEDARIELFDQIKKLYGYRSKIVHGAHLSDKNKNLKGMLHFSEILNSRLFCKILTAGHVSLFGGKADKRDEQLKRLSLGASNAYFKTDA